VDLNTFIQPKFLLQLLPPPSDWKGPIEHVTGLGGYPWHKKIEAAGIGYQNFVRRMRGETIEDKSAKEDAEEAEGADISNEDKQRFHPKKHKKTLELSEDPYEIMGLNNLRWRATDDDIRVAFRKLVIIYHPDKMEQNERTEGDDEIFKKISKANDTLTDPKKRRALDSTDEFDDSIPTGNEKGDFFAVFSPVFHRFSRWSITQPAPLLGEISLSYEETMKFYEFWYSFKSWRDFSFEDEYDVNDAESRDERRWMERQNERERRKHKKEESARIFKLTETAERLDPRIKKQRDELLNEKKKRKDMKNEYARKQKEEVEKKAQMERELKEQEDKKKAEELEIQKKQRQNEAKKLKNLRSKLRSLAKSNTIQFVPSKEEDVELLCNRLTPQKLTAIVEALDQGIPESAKLFEDEVNAIRDEDEKKRIAALAASSPSITASPTAATKAWTDEELSLLARGIAKYPGGVPCRWQVIAEFVGSRSQKEVIAKSKEGTYASSKPPAYQEEDAFNRFAKNKKKLDHDISSDISVRLDDSSAASASSTSSSTTSSTSSSPSQSPSQQKKQKQKTSTPSTSSSTPSSKSSTTTSSSKSTPTPSSKSTPSSASNSTAPSSTTSASESPAPAKEVEWTAEEQKALEKALVAFPASIDNRWEKIAVAVPGKTKKDCILRFKYLVTKIREKEGKPI